MQCVNNLKQFGLAMHNYVDSFQCLPFGKGDNYQTEMPNAPTYARWSTHSQILAFMEQTPLFNNINFNLPPETPFMDSYNMGFMMTFQDPNRENSTVCRDRDVGVSVPLGPGRAGWLARLGRGQQLLRQRGIVALRRLSAERPARSLRAIFPRDRSTTGAASTWRA